MFSQAIIRSMSSPSKQVYLVNVRKCLANRHIHAYHKLYVVYARKPETSSESSTETLAPPEHQSIPNEPPLGPSGHSIIN
jgi:hypothetical protein